MYHLMVVEDEENIRLGLCYLVENDMEGWSVSYAAKDAAEALRALETHPVDLILTDISMAQMDGLDMLQEIRKRQPQILAVIITGYASFRYAQTAIHLGVIDYVLKPISPEKLKEALGRAAEVLNRRQSMLLALSDEANAQLRKAEKEICKAIPKQNQFAIQQSLDLVASLVEGEGSGRDEALHSLYQFFLAKVLDDLNEEGYAPADRTPILQTLEQLRAVVSCDEWEQWKERLAWSLLNAFGASYQGVHQVIRKAIDYLNTHYQDNVTLNSLSSKLNINANYLSDLFKKEMGMGYREYLTRIRINHAKQLLSSGENYSVQEISEYVGYANERYFVDVFKKETNMTPSEYKRQFILRREEEKHERHWN